MMHHSAELNSEIDDKIARALSLLGADRDLLNPDVDALIDDYFGNDGTGNNIRTPIATPKITSHAMNITFYNTWITMTSLIFTDLEPTEDPVSTEVPTPMDADDHIQPEVEPLTAVAVVQAGLQRGNLSDESISINRREIDEVEEQLVQQYACDGCKCDYSPNDTETFGMTWQS